MTIVDTDTGELIETTYAEVRESVDLARESGTKFFEQIVWQIERQAWSVLGHSSWDEMREAEYADIGVAIPRADRPEVVARMRQSGLTQQQIAETVGVSVGTVNADLKFSSENEVGPAPVITNARGQERPASYTPRPTPAPEPAAPAESLASASADHVDLSDFIQADSAVQLTSWRRSFMAHIKRSGELMLFTPEAVADKADPELINELDRLASELTNYIARVHAKRPQRLTAIRGGAK